ncbi:MAG: hypothetical protein ACLFUS_13800 [Candidatus Sumerlaeia bacterium]
MVTIFLLSVAMLYWAWQYETVFRADAENHKIDLLGFHAPPYTYDFWTDYTFEDPKPAWYYPHFYFSFLFWGLGMAGLFFCVWRFAQKISEESTGTG